MSVFVSGGVCVARRADMTAFVIGLFGDMITAIIGAELFAPVTALFLLSLGLGLFLSMMR